MPDIIDVGGLKRDVAVYARGIIDGIIDRDRLILGLEAALQAAEQRERELRVVGDDVAACLTWFMDEDEPDTEAVEHANAQIERWVQLVQPAALAAPQGAEPWGGQDGGTR